MGDFLKKNTITILIIIATIILAGIVIFTAVRLYQLRQTSVAPNAPSSRPAAASLPPSPPAGTSSSINNCQGSFTISAIATATPTPTPTATVSPTPTPTPVAQCGTSCSTNSDCPSSMTCYVGVCRNPSCSASTSCVCATATPTLTPIPTATLIASITSTPSASPSATKPPIPVTGFDTPTIVGMAGGTILLLIGLIIAL